jgi:hypothetical protein
MRRGSSALLLAVVLVIALAVPAGAISFGQPDGNLHPNVGALIIPWNGGWAEICSGTLIAPQVFLTASHCMDWLGEVNLTLDDVAVSFDGVWSENPTVYTGRGVLNPEYPGPESNTHDVAVVLLDQAPAGITPAKLPAAGLLDQMKKDKSLKDTRFVAVGYGVLRNDKTGGPNSIIWDNYDRYYAEQSFLALEPYWLQLSMNPSTGSGGTCYGDSGGPHFIKGTDIVASITVSGDMFCRATDKTYRMDTDSAREFLGQFVALP